MDSIVREATRVAIRAHRGQRDKTGAAYIFHPRRVAAALAAEGFDEEVQAVGWLHDVVEDSDYTLDDLRAVGFSPRVVDAVDAITKRKGESFRVYYERVKANQVALAVKWQDVADNAKPERLSRVAPDTRERLQAKYEAARVVLRSEGP